MLDAGAPGPGRVRRPSGYITADELQPAVHLDHERIIAYGVFDRVLPAGPDGPTGARRDRRDRERGGLMYGALWRVLPGPWWVRVIILLAAGRGGGHRPACSGCSPGLTSSSARQEVTVPNDPRPRHRQLRQLRLHPQRLPPCSWAPRPRSLRNDDFAAEEAAERIAEYDAVLLSPAPARRPTPASRSRSCAPRSPPGRRCSACASDIRRSPRRSVPRSRTPTSSCTARRRSSSTTTRAFYAGVPQPFRATRYHSLAVVDGRTVPDELEVTAAHRRAASSWGCRHRDRRPSSRRAVPPESVLTEGGYRMLGNWLADDQASSGGARLSLAPPQLG